MTYKDWRLAIDPRLLGNPERNAEVWNLEHETRINKTRGLFKRRLGALHKRNVSAGTAPADAAEQALHAAAEEAASLNSKLLGKLPLNPGAPNVSIVMTFRPGDYVRKRMHRTYRDRRDPAHRINIIGPLDSEPDGAGGWTPRKRFIWVTFGDGSRTPPVDDPTAIKRELGLARFSMNDHVYRFTLSIAPGQTSYIPTCLDANLFAAWKRPPSAHSQPWGLTRDLTTGGSRWPELLVETQRYLSDTSPVGHLVSPPETVRFIGPVNIDYMIGR